MWYVGKATLIFVWCLFAIAGLFLAISVCLVDRFTAALDVCVLSFFCFLCAALIRSYESEVWR